MKIFVTGATGFVGQALCQEFVRQGHVVKISTRSILKLKPQPYPCEVIEWNGEVPLSASVLADCDAVVHLMGESVAGGIWTHARKKKIYDSRIESTKLLLRAVESCGLSGPKAIVMASAIGFYGDRGDEILNESSKPGEGFLASVCRAWEAALFESSAQVRKVAVRVGLVLGNGGALKKMIPPFKAGVGGALGSGNQWMSWIHLDDLVQIFSNAISDSKINGVLLGVAPNPIKNKFFSKILAKKLNRRALIPNPELAIRAMLGEMAQLVLASQRVVQNDPPKQLPFKYSFVEEALESLCAVERLGSVFRTQMWIPFPREVVFKFFADEKNLESITPPWLNFNVTNISTPQVAEGTTIDYRLKLKGVPIQWRTLIESWDPSNKFVDSQIKGPYARWHHTHIFESLANGTLMTDIVSYRVPFGILGRLGAGWYVKSDVRKIFEFREKKIRELFK